VVTFAGASGRETRKPLASWVFGQTERCRQFVTVTYMYSIGPYAEVGATAGLLRPATTTGNFHRLLALRGEALLGISPGPSCCLGERLQVSSRQLEAAKRHRGADTRGMKPRNISAMVVAVRSASNCRPLARWAVVGPVDADASIGLRHKPIRHSDVLLAHGGRGEGRPSRMPTRPSRAHSRLGLTAESFIK
jgi:hypothetical protein